MNQQKEIFINQVVQHAPDIVLIPCVGLSKTPRREKGKKYEPDSLVNIRDFPYNYGCILPDSLVVLDLDPRRYPSDTDVFEKLALDIGVPPAQLETFIVQSGSGIGKHLYFKNPIPGQKYKKEAIHNYPGIEIKGPGSFVVAPGSIHPDTHKPYTILSSSLEDILPLPDQIFKYYKAERYSNVERTTDSTDRVILGAENAIGLYRQRLINAPVAVQGQNGDDTTYRTACEGRDYGLDASAVFECMKEWNQQCDPPWDDDALWAKVENAFQYGSAEPGWRTNLDFQPVVSENPDEEMDEEYLQGITWDVDNKGIPKATLRNLRQFFIIDVVEIQGERIPNPIRHLLKRNEFTKLIEFRKPAPWHRAPKVPDSWGKDDTMMFKQWLANKTPYPVTDQQVRETIRYVSDRFSYHPVRDYVEAIEWDGVKRISNLFSYYCMADQNIYTADIARRLLIALIARVFSPGCKYDYVVILEGDQGVGKSQFCQILGGEYYSELIIDLRTKDTYHKMMGKTVIEIPEFVGVTKQDTAHLKAYLAQPTDHYRVPYADAPEAVPRTSIFIATMNPEADHEYLKDQTGNRRFWPIECKGNFRLQELHRDRDQLFAEAYRAFLDGEEWHITDPDVLAFAAKQQAERVIVDPFEDTVRNFLERLDRGVEWIAAYDIAKQALFIRDKDLSARDYKRIAAAMDKNGWLKRKKGDVRGYSRRD